MKKFLVVAFWLSTIAAAFAQTAVKQTGTVTPGHAPLWATNGVIGDAGTAANGFLTSIGTVGNTPFGYCHNSGPITGAYTQLCLGSTTAGGSVITALSFGGASASLSFNVGGTVYPFPYAVGGIVGPNTSVVGHLALWNNTAGSLLNDGGNYVYPPVVADGVTDNTAILNAAISALSSTGGRIHLPTGRTCVSSGIINSVEGITFEGVAASFTFGGSNGSILSACGADVTTLALNAPESSVVFLTVEGKNSLTATKPAVLIDTGCNQCRFMNSEAKYGTFTIQNKAADTVIENTRSAQAYGSAQIYLNGGNVFIKNHVKTNNAYPAGAPASVPITISPWASTTAYSTKAIATLTQGGINWMFQATVGGTSGGSTPTILPYGQSFTDGTVTWALLGQSTYYGIQADTGSSSAAIDNADTSGGHTAGIAITNTLAGVAPGSTVISNSTPGNFLGQGILLNAGSGVLISNLRPQGCYLANCAGVLMNGTFAGDAKFVNVTTGQVARGIDIQAGTNIVVSNSNLFTTSGVGVNIAANLNDISILGNQAGASAGLGTNANCITIAVGTGDYLNVVNNDCNGAGAGITNGATGTHNRVQESSVPLTPANGGTGATALGAEFTNSGTLHLSSVANSFKGNNTGSTATTLDLTVAQAQALLSYPEIIGGTAANVNLNSATTDTAITITSPTTNYIIAAVLVKNKGTTASLTTATAGLFTTTGGGGVALAADQALAGITSNTVNTASNALALTITNGAKTWLNSATLQFRVGTAQGASATGDVYVYIRPLP